MRCQCGAPAGVITRHGPRCGRCWLAEEADRDATRLLQRLGDAAAAALCAGCADHPLPTSGLCWAHDPAVVHLERFGAAQAERADPVTHLVRLARRTHILSPWGERAA